MAGMVLYYVSLCKKIFIVKISEAFYFTFWKQVPNQCMCTGTMCKRTVPCAASSTCYLFFNFSKDSDTI